MCVCVCDCVCVCHRRGNGQAMLDKARAAGRPITPQMEKMAQWMDQMEESAATGDAPMLKPGK